MPVRLHWTLKFDFCTVFMPLNIFPYPFKNNLFLAHGHTKTKIDWNFACGDWFLDFPHKPEADWLFLLLFCLGAVLVLEIGSWHQVHLH